MARPTQGYYNADGKRIPGTTTITGRFKESGALMYWACEQGKAIERGEIRNLYDKRDAAAEAGTLAHELVETHLNQNHLPSLEEYPEETAQQAKQGFQNYLKWQENNTITIVYQEVELVSEEHQFGGCPDAIGTDDSKDLFLLDWKTSNGVYSDYLIQLAAYAILWEENYPDMPLSGFHLLRFSKEYADFSHHYWSNLDDAKEMFLLYCQAYGLDKKLKKRTG